MRDGFLETAAEVERLEYCWGMALLAAHVVWEERAGDPMNARFAEWAPLDDDLRERTLWSEDAFEKPVTVLDALRQYSSYVLRLFEQFGLDADWAVEAGRLFGRHCEGARDPGSFSEFDAIYTKQRAYGFKSLYRAIEARQAKAAPPAVAAPPPVDAKLQAAAEMDDDISGAVTAQARLLDTFGAHKGRRPDYSRKFVECFLGRREVHRLDLFTYVYGGGKRTRLKANETRKLGRMATRVSELGAPFGLKYSPGTPNYSKTFQPPSA